MTPELDDALYRLVAARVMLRLAEVERESAALVPVFHAVFNKREKQFNKALEDAIDDQIAKMK